MDIIIANENFERLGMIENASVIWASRYYKTGDFELNMTASKDNLDMIMNGKYVIRDDDDDNIGVIEDYVISGSLEDGDNINVTGKFASGYYLSKRVVSQQTQLFGNTELQVRNLLKDNLIEPKDNNRKIPFILLGNRDSSITEHLELQTTGDQLLSKVEEICEGKHIGFRMPLRGENLYFEMYKGIDRSYAQVENPWVIFSDEYDNLKDVSYTYTTSELKNFAYVAGEGEGLARKIVTSYNTDTEPTGADRNEKWVDKRDISSNDGEITESEIVAQMKEQGAEELTTITEAFDGSVSLSGYKYGKQENGGDVYLGDIVSIEKKKWNGIYINARIIEVIESCDQNGEVITLTFGI